MHFTPRQELGWVESRETRVRQRVRLLARVLVAQSQGHGECGRYLPVVLKKVVLAELAGLDYRGAENPAGSGGGSTEVVQEIRESGISQGQGLGERDSPQCRGRPSAWFASPEKESCCRSETGHSSPSRARRH